MNKNKIIAISLLSILAIFAGANLLAPEKDVEVAPISPTIVPALPTTINTQSKIEISGIETNDFLTTPIKSNPSGDVLFSQTADFQLVYLSQYSKFIIDIYSTTQSSRDSAEKSFTDSLGISKEDACKLNVRVAQKYSPEFPGSENKRLSFCPQTTPGP